MMIVYKLLKLIVSEVVKFVVDFVKGVKFVFNV